MGFASRLHYRVSLGNRVIGNMASGLLMLLDDIATILDDVSVLTQLAAKKTAGVLGDDLALNAQQVSGIAADRELPVVWAVAKGSMVNKGILIPAALLFSALLPWLIVPLMIVGGAYLCFEGCEKLAHKFFHPRDEAKHRHEHEANIADAKIDIVAAEKTKIAGAVRTDFILSAEIIVITLGTVAAYSFMTRLAVLVAIGLLMTVGVYGLVAGIVKLDDLGLYLIQSKRQGWRSKFRVWCGHAILASAPFLMKFLSIAGTAAMFLVGGGILVHGIPALHHWVDDLVHGLEQWEPLGWLLAPLTEMLIHGLIGVLIGTLVLIVVIGCQAAHKFFFQAANSKAH